MISRRQFLLSSFAASAGLAATPGVFAATQAQADLDPGDWHQYARLFPRRAVSQPGSDVERGLIALANEMVDKKIDNNDKTGDAKNLAAGYTYLGQFIDHDLTLDITPLDHVRVDVENVTNFRTPFLDLDQLYGGGPNISPFLYRKHGSADSPEGQERFLLGATAAGKRPDQPDRTLASTCNDLPRNSQGTALAGDPRQDENLILAQLHVAFLKLHNLVLDHPPELDKSPYYKIKPLFGAARRVVTWHYQWIVRHDFLKRIVDETVFDQLDDRDYKPLIGRSPRRFRIPVEFSAAAFRFGHSMVRNEYHYNQWHEDAKLLEELFQRTGFGNTGNVPVPEEWRISWDRFFKFLNPFILEKARKIDTKIAEDLFSLPPLQIRAFSAVPSPKMTFASDPPQLPIRTLLRGARLGLPTGQDVARKVLFLEPKTRVLTTREITNGPHEKILKENGFDTDTPLWYYTLKEAEIRGAGDKLGPIGSRLVADVILASLASDPDSYVSVAGADWRPTLWTSTSETDKNPSDMSKLLQLLLPETSTRACSST